MVNNEESDLVREVKRRVSLRKQCWSGDLRE